MATFEDVVVRLFLDATGLAQGQKDAVASTEKSAADLAASATKGEKAQVDAHKRTTSSVEKMAGAIVASNKKAAESFERVLRVGLTLLSVFAGAKSVEEFTRKVVSLDAALGRLGHNIGQTPDTLSSIGQAAQRMGGSFDGAVNGMKGLSDAFQDLRTTGTNGIMEPLARLQALSGKPITFGKDVHANFLSIAEALKAEDAKDPALADRLGRQILGNDESLVNLAKLGRAGVLEQEKASRRHGVIDPKDAAAAQKLQSSFEALTQSVTDFGRKIATAVAPALSDLITWLDDIIDRNKEWIATRIGEYVQTFVDYVKSHKADIEDFGRAIGTIAAAFAGVVAAVSGQSPLAVAFEAFGALLAGKVLLRLTSILETMRLIGGLPLTGALAVLAGAPAESTPNPETKAKQDQFYKDNPDAPKTVFGAIGNWWKDHAATWMGGNSPEAADRAREIEKANEANKAEADTYNKKHGLTGSPFTDVWNSLKSKIGMGGADTSDDSRVRDAIIATAKGVDDLNKTVKDGGGMGGATVNAGGGATIGRGSPNLRYGRRGEGEPGRPGRDAPGGKRETYRGTPVPDAPYNGKNIDGLSERATKQYASILGNRESGNRYGTTNPYGYVGRWQMGADALAENGYVKRGTTNAGLNDPSKWIGKGDVHSVAEFKANKNNVQDTEFGEYTNRHYAQLKAAGVIRDGMKPADVAGWLAAAHLKGVGGAEALARGRDNVDANGTSASSYRRMMAGVGSSTPAALVASTPPSAGTSTAVITDAEVFAARQRIVTGSRDPKDKALTERYLKEQNTPKGSSAPASEHAIAARDRGPGGSPGEVARVEIEKPTVAVPPASVGENDRETRARRVPPPIEVAPKSSPAPQPVGPAPVSAPKPAPVPSAVADYAREHNAGRPQVPNMPGSVGMLPAGRMMTPDVPRLAPVPSAAGGYGREHNAGRPQVPNMSGSASMLPAGRMLTLDDAANHVLKTMKGANDNGRPVKVDLTDGSATKIGVAGKSGMDMLMARHSGSIRAKVGAELNKSHAEMDRAFGKAWTGLGHHAGIGAGERAWAAVNHAHHQTTTHNVDNSTATKVGTINVHTAATDAKGIAADIEPHLARGQAAGRGNYGLA